MGRHSQQPRLRFMTLRLDEFEYDALARAAADTGHNKGEILRAGLYLWLENPGQLPASAIRRDSPNRS